MLTQAWYRKSWWLILLWPLSFVFFLVSSLRRYCYQLGLKKQHHFALPIVIVGNITVGGTGKTPFVVYLIELLIAANYKPGIVLRGYGGNDNHQARLVTEHSEAQAVGDEALLLARNVNCPIAICRRRAEAVQLLTAQTDCNIIVSDDGLQHYALARDIEIALIDGSRRLGNGWLLPAGPLRESAKRLQQCDFVICNGANHAGEYRMDLQAQHFRSLIDTNLAMDAEYFLGKTIHAVAAIGNPQRFFKQLLAMGLTIIQHSFPDHHAFSKADIDFEHDDIIIMTEKDAVKCFAFADYRHWYLPVAATVDENFKTALLAKINTISQSEKT